MQPHTGGISSSHAYSNRRKMVYCGFIEMTGKLSGSFLLPQSRLLIVIPEFNSVRRILCALCCRIDRNPYRCRLARCKVVKISKTVPDLNIHSPIAAQPHMLP